MKLTEVVTDLLATRLRPGRRRVMMLRPPIFSPVLDPVFDHLSIPDVIAPSTLCSVSNGQNSGGGGNVVPLRPNRRVVPPWSCWRPVPSDEKLRQVGLRDAAKTGTYLGAKWAAVAGGMTLLDPPWNLIASAVALGGSLVLAIGLGLYFGYMNLDEGRPSLKFEEGLKNLEELRRSIEGSVHNYLPREARILRYLEIQARAKDLLKGLQAFDRINAGYFWRTNLLLGPVSIILELTSFLRGPPGLRTTERLQADFLRRELNWCLISVTF